MLVLDVSGSMAAKDVQPTRLLAADEALTQFLQKLPAKYRASLVTFGEDTAVLVPPTVDRARVIAALPKKALPVGTALGDGIVTATLVATKAIGPVKKGTQRSPAAILMVSDGTQNTGRVST